MTNLVSSFIVILFISCLVCSSAFALVHPGAATHDFLQRRIRGLNHGSCKRKLHLVPPQSRIDQDPSSLSAGPVRELDSSIKVDSPPSLSRTQSLILLTIISAIYGTNYTAIRIMGDAGLDGGFSSLIRFLLATLCFLPSTLRVLVGSPTSPARRDILYGGLQIGTLNGIGYLFQSTAVNAPGALVETVAFISCLSVVVVPLLDCLFGAQRFSLDKFYPAFLALAGVMVLELSGSWGDGGGGGGGGGMEVMTQQGGQGLSLAYILAAAAQPLFFGIAFYRLERLIKRCSQPQHFAAFTGANLFAVSFLSLVWFIASTGPDVSILEHTVQQSRLVFGGIPAISSLLWTGLVTSAACTLYEGVAMKGLTGSEVTVVYSSEPVFATLWAAFFLGEEVQANTAIGALLIFGACWLSQKQRKGVQPVEL